MRAPEPEPVAAARLRSAGKWLLAGLLAVVVYRAATQAVTHDEALTWLAHVGGPHAKPFESGTNNHILFTQLARLSTSLLGAGDFALRLPSVFGALLFFVATYRLCRRAFRTPAPFALGLGLTVLNPYTLDFLVAARGYSLGLGCSMLALDQMHAWCADRRHVRLVAAGAGLGAAVAAQLTFAPFAASMALSLALFEASSPRWTQLGARLRAGVQVLLSLGVTMAVTGGPWAAVLLWDMEPGGLYGGVESLAEAGRLLAERSLLHARDEFVPERAEWVRQAVGVATTLLAPAILLGLVPAVSAAYRRRARTSAGATPLASLDAVHAGLSGAGRSALLPLAGAAALLVPLALTGAVWLAPRLGMEFTYPDPRRCVGYLPLFGIATAALLERLLEGRALRLVGRLLALACVLLVARFAVQFETSYFADWRFDAGARRIFERLEVHHAEHADLGRGTPVRLAVQPWLYESALNYYRDVEGASAWLEHVERFPRLGEGGYAYFVLDPATDPDVAGEVAEAVYQDPVSRVWLFARR